MKPTIPRLAIAGGRAQAHLLAEPVGLEFRPQGRRSSSTDPAAR